ncbi:uncharacterized protein Z518_05559 [Rhinocladiella mackenziei CBS 650.93]|uniref:Organic solute transporter Ostalpha n=1 Tax=Rhinocladiella mackenziei CBS 650.93 TaxID=1442369 RepID=A0A0D2IFV0_9EURO|nr:uncharacterized protein Z518_05559 [Rhinocladiella mackenziei CBS 650.93]KIX04689.1 hypothetical protein Z518_05559 [Rhinocladiella mackenziei CBS 650.93]
MAHVLIAKLLKRQLLGGDSSSEDEEDCPSNFDDDSQADPIVGDTTFHQIMMYTSIGCAIVTVIVSFFLVWGQMSNYREPRVQKQLIRVILTAPVFAVLCMLGVASYRLTHYVEPLAEFYEVFTLVALFLLFIAYLVPSTQWHTQVAFFSNPKHGGFKFFKKRYIFVMQVVPGRITTTIAALAINVMKCRGSGGSSFDAAQAIISIVNAVQLILAISGIFPFLMKQRATLKLTDPQIMGKLISVKVIVVVQIVVHLVLQILSWTGSLEPTATLSYNDLNLGLSVFLTTILAMITAFLMVPYFRPRQFERKPLADLSGTEYGPSHHFEYEEDGSIKMGGGSVPADVKPKASRFRAILDTINILDVLQGVGRACKLLGHRNGYSLPSHQNGHS